MKICICVQSTNHSLYLSNAKTMVSSYNRISLSNNLPVKCFFFLGNNDNFSYYDNMNAIILGCDDNNVSEKHFNLLDVLLNTEWMNFDVLVHTTSGTVLNILKLYEFIEKEYDAENAYCGSIVNYWKTNTPDLIYPNGNLCIYSRNICDILLKNWKTSVEEIHDIYGLATEREEGSDLMWYGISEDFIIGYILNKHKINLIKMDNVLNFRTTNFDNMDYMKPNIYDYVAIYAKTHKNNIDARTLIEPNIIEFLSLMFERHSCCHMMEQTF